MFVIRAIFVHFFFLSLCGYWVVCAMCFIFLLFLLFCHHSILSLCYAREKRTNTRRCDCCNCVHRAAPVVAAFKQFHIIFFVCWKKEYLIHFGGVRQCATQRKNLNKSSSTARKQAKCKQRSNREKIKCRV